MCLFRRGEGGGTPQIACTGKFSGFRLYEKEGVSLVEVQ